MASTLSNARIWYDGVALGSQANAVQVDHTADALEDTVFTDTARSRIAGLKDSAMQVSGFFNSTEDKEMFDGIAAAKPFTVSAGATVGVVAYLMNSLSTSHGALEGSVGDVLGFSLQGQTTGALVRGALGFNGTSTGLEDGTAIQLGAIAATQSLYASFHLTAITGTDIGLRIGSDDAQGFPSTATVGAEQTLSAASPSAWLKVDGALTDDWFRVSVTSGTFSSATFAVGFGVAITK